jgi:hypothetical protein
MIMRCACAEDAMSGGVVFCCSLNKTEESHVGFMFERMVQVILINIPFLCTVRLPYFVSYHKLASKALNWTLILFQDPWIIMTLNLNHPYQKSKAWLNHFSRHCKKPTYMTSMCFFQCLSFIPTAYILKFDYNSIKNKKNENLNQLMFRTLTL